MSFSFRWKGVNLYIGYINVRGFAKRKKSKSMILTLNSIEVGRYERAKIANRNQFRNPKKDTKKPTIRKCLHDKYGPLDTP